jgi:DNA-binding CsgD family transcriptional regulator
MVAAPLAIVTQTAEQAPRNPTMLTATLSHPADLAPAYNAPVYSAPSNRMPAAQPGMELATRLLRSLDHVGRGMLLVGAGARVLHANRMASLAIADSHPLHISQGRLQARNLADEPRLAAALQAAMQRGLRQMLHLGEGANRVTVAVLPIDDEGGGAALVSLEQPRRTQRTQDLAVQCYARQHSLTGAETAVLEALLDGQTPNDVARAKQVAVSTVRTQIGQLRLKTGTRSIRQLLDRVGGLPPMMVVVQ